MKFPITRSARLGWATALAGTTLALLAVAPSAHAATRTGGFEVAFTAPDSREWHMDPIGRFEETPSALAPDTSPSLAPLPDGQSFVDGFEASDGTLWVGTETVGNPETGHQVSPCGSAFNIQPGSGPSIATTPGGDWRVVTTQHLSSSAAAIIETGTDLAAEGVCAANVSNSPGSGTPDIANLATGGYAATFVGSEGAAWVADASGARFAGNGLGVEHGTSPVIAADVSGGWEIAFQGADNHLWTVDSSGHQTQTPYTLDPTTGVGIAGLSTGGYELVWKAASNGELYEMGPSGVATVVANGLGMAENTSPAIAADNAGGFKIAFHAFGENTVWTVDSENNIGFDTHQAIWANTSPAITYLKNAAILV